MGQDLARQRLKEAGFQVAEQATPVNSNSPAGAVVGTSPSGQTVPGSIITIQVSNGIAPAPPPPPPGAPPIDPNDPNAIPAPVGSTVVLIPGLPPITVPVLGPPPPP
jgi:beta-lactam-binding protein with PASTA domain